MKVEEEMKMLGKEAKVGERSPVDAREARIGEEITPDRRNFPFSIETAGNQEHIGVDADHRCI